jgi:hypothetical protein
MRAGLMRAGAATPGKARASAPAGEAGRMRRRTELWEDIDSIMDERAAGKEYIHYSAHGIFIDNIPLTEYLMP